MIRYDTSSTEFFCFFGSKNDNEDDVGSVCVRFALFWRLCSSDDPSCDDGVGVVPSSGPAHDVTRPIVGVVVFFLKRYGGAVFLGRLVVVVVVVVVMAGGGVVGAAKETEASS